MALKLGVVQLKQTSLPAGQGVDIGHFSLGIVDMLYHLKGCDDIKAAGVKLTWI